MIIQGITVRGINIVDGTVAAPVLVLSYPLDNSSCWPGSGTTITDQSGNGNNGTLQNSPTLGATFITSKGGVTPSYISTTYNLASTWTVSTIVNISATQTYWATLWGNDSWTAGLGWLLYYGSSQAGNLGRAGAAGSTASVTTAFGTKLLITCTYDGTNYKYYSNGTLVTTSSSYPSYALSTTNTYFGARHSNGGTGATDGINATFYRMDIYRGAQNAAAVTAYYNSIKTQYGI